jgi:hypothetical protein
MMRPPLFMCFSAADDAAAALHVLQRGLCRDEHATDVDVNHAIHLLQRGLFERLGNGGAGIVHQHIKPAEGRNGLLDRSLHSFSVGGVCLNRDSLSGHCLQSL